MSVPAMACLSAGQREKVQDGVRPLTVVEMREVRGSDTIVPGGVCVIGTPCLVGGGGFGPIACTPPNCTWQGSPVCGYTLGAPLVHNICSEADGKLPGPGCTGRNITGCFNTFTWYCAALPNGPVFTCNCVSGTPVLSGQLAICW